MPLFTNIDHAVMRFFEDLSKLPVEEPIDGVLEKAIAGEREIRALFALDSHNEILKRLHLGLVDVFNLHPTTRRSRTRGPCDGERNDRQYIFPVNDDLRRPYLMPSTVLDITIFQHRWNIFTYGALSKMTRKDWNNVVAAGGAVLACLMHKEATDSELNAWYQSEEYRSADIDLFLWGLSAREAEKKMNDIYEAVCAAAACWKVTCVRRANTVSIHTTYPRRPIQIILRLYQSPAEILAGFDIDSACCAYDGVHVWVNPRSLAALVRQVNTIDLSRRSPSYEMRLAKYAARGFEIYFPSLQRDKVGAWLYSINLPSFPNGLARLLVLEKAYYNPGFYRFFGYPKARYLRNGSISQDMARDVNDLPSNNYDGNLSWAQIPYGIQWDADRIEKLISDQDAWLNSLHNPRNKNQLNHRHVFFAGTMLQCLGTFCANCDDTEVEQEMAPGFGLYIKGPISFITSNPGRQLLTGSFRPIELGEWEWEAYSDANPRVDARAASQQESSSDSGSEYTDARSEFLPDYSE